MITLKIQNNPDTDWNKRLLGSDLGSNRQSKEMGERYEQTNKTPIFMTFTNSNGKIVGQLLCSTYSRMQNKDGLKKLFGKLSKIRQTLCQWEYGPIIFDESYSTEIYEKLGNYILEKNYFVTGWQHPLCTKGIITLKNNFELIPWCTYLIDLSLPTSQLYENIEKHSGRKNIERSEKRNVKIESINDNNLVEFLELRNKTKEDTGLEKKDFEDLFKWWKLMKPLGLSGFLAKKDNKAVGGLLYSFFDRHIIEIAVARSKEDTTEKLYSQDLIKWNIIKWGVENNMKYYNLAGANPNPTSSKEEGILRYKKKWGGQRYDYFNLKSK